MLKNQACFQRLTLVFSANETWMQLCNNFLASGMGIQYIWTGVCYRILNSCYLQSSIIYSYLSMMHGDDRAGAG